MGKILVNEDAVKTRIVNAIEKSITCIKANANKGIKITELIIDKDIASDVREELEKLVEGIEFLVVRRSPNPYTGRMQSFTSEVIGDNKHYKVHI